MEENNLELDLELVNLKINYGILIRDERQKALRQIWCSAWKNYFMKNPEKITEDCGLLYAPIMDDYIKKARCGWKYYFITVNPAEVKFEYLDSRMVKFLKKCWIDKWMFCYEQRGDGREKPLGSGKHVHILVSLNKYKRPGEVKRETYNTFKNCCGSVKSVVVKGVMECENFVNYICGQKKSVEKMEKVLYDVEWRKMLKIDNVYDNGFLEE